jgi:methionyl-tRNA synthetase
MNKEKYLVTAALPYANGPLHLGHIAGAYLPADIFVKYKKSCGHDVVFISGADEHGVPITIKAETLGLSPKELVDQNYELLKEGFEKLNIDFSIFSRTTSKIHHETAIEFYNDIKKNGFLSEKDTEQLQCQSCKTYLADRYVEGTCPKCSSSGARGDQCESCGSMLNPAELIDPKCKVCGSSDIELKMTKHDYLKLGDFQDKLEKWITAKDNWKENVVNYCKNWFKEGLNDRAITRSMSWGVKVPGHEDKVLYVWFDAPIGYISMTKEWAINQGKPELWKEYWQDKETKLIHFIGKDNIVFHAIIFPAILLGKNQNYVLPENVPANEFLNLEGDKLSTSRNYAVWVLEYLEKFSSDSLRYYLASNMPENKDADFSWKSFQAHHNSELADVLGNFVNRTFTFVHNYFDGRVPSKTDLTDLDNEALERISVISDNLSELLDKFQNRKTTETIMELVRFSNKYFNDSEPWKTRKDNIERCATSLNISLQLIKKISIIFYPIIPDTSKKIWKMLNITGSVEKSNWFEFDELPVGHKIANAEILFTKIDDHLIQTEIDRLEKIKKELNTNVTYKPVKEEITIEDFNKIDLRLGKIIAAEAVPKAKKLLKLVVDLGFEKRQVVSGIAEFYKPEALINKQVTMVVNLKPVTLRGVDSEGMILAIEGADKNLELLDLKTGMPIGASIR